MTASTSAAPAADQRLRLSSVVARENGEDPIGSAWSTNRCIVLELPLPWPTSFFEARAFPAGLTDILLETYEKHPTWGFIAIAPDVTRGRAGWTRVIDFHSSEPPRAAARRTEFLVKDDAVTGFIAALLSDAGDARPSPDVEVQPFTGRDLLVCTHGTVDACCARFGYPMYRQLCDIAGRTNGAVRIWRSTHFGGHRFAPTVLDLPEGRYWGFLGPQTAEQLVLRDGQPDALRTCYRGWAGYIDPEAQLLEREALVREGWDWTTWPQECSALEHDREGRPVRLRLLAYPPDGSVIAYEGRIEDAGEIETLFETGGEPSRKRQHRIADLRRWTLTP